MKKLLLLVALVWFPNQLFSAGSRTNNFNIDVLSITNATGDAKIIVNGKEAVTNGANISVLNNDAGYITGSSAGQVFTNQNNLFTINSTNTFNAPTFMNSLNVTNGNIDCDATVFAALFDGTDLQIAEDFVQSGQASTAVSAAGKLKSYFDSDDNRWNVSQNGGAFYYPPIPTNSPSADQVLKISSAGNYAYWGNDLNTGSGIFSAYATTTNGHTVTSADMGKLLIVSTAQVTNTLPAASTITGAVGFVVRSGAMTWVEETANISSTTSSNLDIFNSGTLYDNACGNDSSAYRGSAGYGWLKVTLSSPKKIGRLRWCVVNGDRQISWQISGSNLSAPSLGTDSDWTVLDTIDGTQHGCVSNGPYTNEFVNGVSYLHYRLRLTQTTCNPNVFDVSELDLDSYTLTTLDALKTSGLDEFQDGTQIISFDGTSNATLGRGYILFSDGTNKWHRIPLDSGRSLQIDEMAAPNVSAADTATIYLDSSLDKLRVSENAGAFYDLVPNVYGAVVNGVTDSSGDVTVYGPAWFTNVIGATITLSNAATARFAMLNSTVTNSVSFRVYVSATGLACGSCSVTNTSVVFIR